MNKDFIQRFVLFVLSLACTLIISWNTYLHNSMQDNRDEVQAVRIKIAEEYVTAKDMDKFITRMEKRFDRLDAKIDSK